MPKFLIDECIGYSIVEWLQQKNYDVVFLEDSAIGVSDPEVLEIAFKADRVLITCDKDFGEIIFSKKQKHCGLILLRLASYARAKKIKILEKILADYKGDINGNFIVATDTNIRVIKF